VIDNSSAFRMDPSVPLVVPEINGDAAQRPQKYHRQSQLLYGYYPDGALPLHKAFGVTRIFASTYQAVSGTGAQAVAELERQVNEIVNGKEVTKEVYPKQIAFNVLPHVDVFLDSGYTKEEMKMENEGRKIMSHPDFKASVTCVRVPVYRAHSIAVSAELKSQSHPNAAREVLAKFPGSKSSMTLHKIPTRLRSKSPAKTTAKSAASAKMWHLKTAYLSGSSATNSSKAPPSTPSKSLYMVEKLIGRRK
jgi:aspartate-semialdehyde dehydrogenase